MRSLHLAELNYEIAQGVIKSDDEVDRFSLYILRNLVIASQNERILREIGLRKPSDCLSYRVTVKSIERIADHAYGCPRAPQIKEKIPIEIFRKIEKMSEISLTALNDAVEAFLRRDYTLADRTVDRAKSLRSLENDIILLLDKEEEKKTIRNPLSNINIRLIFRRYKTYTLNIRVILLEAAYESNDRRNNRKDLDSISFASVRRSI